MVELVARSGPEAGDLLSALAELRLRYFREWPYLYDGNLGSERFYLRSYHKSPRSLVIGAYDGDRIVGVATALPMSDHQLDFRAVIDELDLREDRTLYRAEIIIRPEYRRQGIRQQMHQIRKTHAAAIGCTHTSFCYVQRSADHPQRPDGYRTPEDLWRGWGYQKAQQVVTSKWRDIGETEPSVKTLHFWWKRFSTT